MIPVEALIGVVLAMAFVAYVLAGLVGLTARRRGFSEGYDQGERAGYSIGYREGKSTGRVEVIEQHARAERERRRREAA